MEPRNELLKEIEDLKRQIKAHQKEESILIGERDEYKSKYLMLRGLTRDYK